MNGTMEPWKEHDAGARQRILSLFESWLDEVLEEEGPLEGVGAELLTEVMGAAEEPGKGCDLYSLWAGMTALTQEVKLQSRAFKQLSDALQSHSAPQPQGELSQRDRAHLTLLLDIRDRLVRGRETARAYLEEARRRPQRSWLRRLFGKGDQKDHLLEAGLALEKGYLLSLERLDEELGRQGVGVMDCQGQMFDPHRMQAVDLAHAEGVPEGTVLEVYRTGYEWRGEVFRTAEVKVARGKDGENEKG